MKEKAKNQARKFKMGMVLFSFALASCSSVPKSQLMSANPQDGFNEVQMIKNKLISEHVDLFASKKFDKGLEEYNEAIEESREGEDVAELLEDLEESKGYFLAAKQESIGIKASERVLESRSAAINSGAYSSKDLSEELDEIDSDFRKETSNFEKELTSEEFSTIQKRYLALEVKAIQNTKLGSANASLEKLMDLNADELAPMTLLSSQKDIQDAKNKIAQNPKLPSYYMTSVRKAYKSTAKLHAVMDKLTGSAVGSSEKVALTLVKNSDVINSQNNMLVAQEVVLEDASSKINFQETMDKVRNSFSDEIASVYQQGNNLIIRVKDIDFQTGSAKIPASSTNTLAKINTIINSLNPATVTIEGHTDSRGSTSLNEKLSSNRANSVESFFVNNGASYEIMTKGFGESKPIAKNDTANGREMNRRVDLVVEVK